MGKQRNNGQAIDSREIPAYTIPEAAHYLDVPRTTLRWWAEGRHIKVRGQRRRKFYPPLIAIADRRNHLLSFFNLVECHVLAATRHRKVPMRSIRDNIDYLKEITNSERPLLTADLATFGKQLIAVDDEGTHINISRRGQAAFEVVLRSYLERIDRDSLGLPRQFSPVRFRHASVLTEAPVTINPLVASGAPVVAGSAISAAVLWKRSHSGESIAELADDYGLAPIAIQKAISYFSKAA